MDATRGGGTRFALRNRARLAYDPGTARPAEGASRTESPTVVCLHDLLGDRSEFTAVRAALAPASRIVSIDARGHGASATLANQWYTVSELAADVVAVLDAEGVPSAHFVGRGLGGATAIEIARRRPERVRSLVVIEPSLYAILDNDDDRKASSLRKSWRTADRAAADSAYKGLTEKALDAYLEPRWGTDWRGSIPKTRLAAIRRHAGALSGLLPALDSYAMTRAEVRTGQWPALVMTGADALEIDRLVADRLASLCPSSTAVTVELGPRSHRPLGGAAGEAVSGLILDWIGKTEAADADHR
ncbi:MAG: alpha/beta fold hydrolase [Thermomicrobiales bacterium]